MCNCNCHERKVWQDHIAYTRLLIQGYFSVPQRNLAGRLLLMNAWDIGHTLMPEQPQIVKELFMGHNQHLVDYIEGKVLQDPEKQQQALSELFVNTTKIAALIEGIGKNREVFTDLFGQHLNYTRAYIDARFSGSRREDEKSFSMVIKNAEDLRDFFMGV